MTIEFFVYKNVEFFLGFESMLDSMETYLAKKAEPGVKNASHTNYLVITDNINCVKNSGFEDSDGYDTTD